MSANGSIVIRGYEVTACHGVNPEEKTDAQRFSVSAVLDFDITEAAENDDIDKTVSYAAVCKLIKAFLCGESKNLLECLALSLARKIMLAYPAFSRAEVTVDKPDAPMKGTFRSVAVRAEVKRTTAYLSMGSSMGDRDAYMDKAVRLLAADPLVLSVTESRRKATQPYGGIAENEFLNSAVKVVTLLDANGLLALMHRAEKECGRERKVRWGDRTLDLARAACGDSAVRRASAHAEARMRAAGGAVRLQGRQGIKPRGNRVLVRRQRSVRRAVRTVRNGSKIKDNQSYELDKFDGLCVRDGGKIKDNKSGRDKMQ